MIKRVSNGFLDIPHQPGDIAHDCRSLSASCKTEKHFLPSTFYGLFVRWLVLCWSEVSKSSLFASQAHEFVLDEIPAAVLRSSSILFYLMASRLTLYWSCRRLCVDTPQDWRTYTANNFCKNVFDWISLEDTRMVSSNFSNRSNGFIVDLHLRMEQNQLEVNEVREKRVSLHPLREIFPNNRALRLVLANVFPEANTNRMGNIRHRKS